MHWRLAQMRQIAGWIVRTQTAEILLIALWSCVVSFMCDQVPLVRTADAITLYTNCGISTSACDVVYATV